MKLEKKERTSICHNCGEVGHGRKDCPLPLDDNKYLFAKCHICGEKGHLDKYCQENPDKVKRKGSLERYKAKNASRPEQVDRFGDKKICFNCGSADHQNMDCPEPLSVGSNGQKGLAFAQCSNCH